MAKKKRATRRRRSPLSSASVQDLQRELEARGRQLGTLERQRDRLVADLERVEADIEALGGSTNGSASRGTRAGGRRTSKKKTRRRAAGRGRKTAASGRRKTGRRRRRAQNDMNLSEALGKVLKNKTMSVTEAADAVQQAGYKTTSAGNFRTIVNQTLIKDPGFKRVSRGQYTAK